MPFGFGPGLLGGLFAQQQIQQEDPNKLGQFFQEAILPNLGAGVAGSIAARPAEVQPVKESMATRMAKGEEPPRQGLGGAAKTAFQMTPLGMALGAVGNGIRGYLKAKYPGPAGSQTALVQPGKEAIARATETEDPFERMRQIFATLGFGGDDEESKE